MPIADAVGSGGVTNPAGSNTQIQYNNNGSFGANSNLTYNGTTFGLTGFFTTTECAVFEKSIVTKGVYDNTAGTGSYAVMDYLNTGGRIISRGTNDTTKGTFTIVTEATDFDPANNAMVIANDNDVTFLGTVTSGSDLKLKTNIRDFEDMTNIVKQLRPIVYKKTYKTEANERSSSDYFGFVAQEIQTLLPDLVHKNIDTDITGTPKGTETLSLSYIELIPVLTKAIQELETRITALEASLS